MVGAAIAVVAVVLLAGVVYVDRALLKTKLAAAEAAVASKLDHIESAVKADVHNQLQERVAMVRAWAAKEKADAEAVLGQIEGHITQLFAGVKKAL